VADLYNFPTGFNLIQSATTSPVSRVKNRGRAGDIAKAEVGASIGASGAARRFGSRIPFQVGHYVRPSLPLRSVLLDQVC